MGKRKQRDEVVIVTDTMEVNPRAKTILMDALHAAGFEKKDFRWTHCLDNPPPQGKNVTKTMIKNERPAALDRIYEHKPKYVVLFGATPLTTVTELTGISKVRGKPFLHGDKKRVIIPTINPHQAMADEKWEYAMRQDLRRLRECVDFGGIPEEKELDYVTVDNKHKLRQMYKALRGTVAVDLETSRLYPYTTMMDKQIKKGTASKALLDAHKATHGSNNLPRVVAMQFGCRFKQYVVPMETAGIWSKKQLKKIVRKVTKLLMSCYTVFHNGKFDCLWMLVRFGVRWHVDFDTLLAHYICDENDLHGLKYLAQKFFGVPDWDIGGKDKTSWSPTNAKYAAHDVFYTRKLRFYLQKMLDEDWETKHVFNKILMPCVDMFIDAEFKGVYINMDQFDEAEKALREITTDALAKLEKWAKKATVVDKKTGKLNWGSSDQLANLLFKDLKIKSIEKTKGGKDSVSESVLLRIDHPMVGDLLAWRAAAKQLSSFIDGWRPYLDLDGRLHPSFKLHGTVTGRLSCENPNLQQVPRDPRIRTLITAAPGYTLIEADLSQIELRIAAELADEHALLQVFNDGGDPHWQTAIREIERGAGRKKEMIKTAKAHHLMLGKEFKKMNYSQAVEYVLSIGGDGAVDAVKHWTETKNLEKAFVDWKEDRKKAKAINFGYLYGMWWKKFKIYARDNYGVVVTDDEAQASRESFFALYPGFPDWHDKQRRFAQVNGYVRSLSGRKRRLPKAMGGRDTPERREAQRQAINSPVQSFANELNLMAALQMRDEFSPDFYSLVGTVHDAVLIEVRNDKVEEVYHRVLKIMSKPKLLKKFDIKLSVPIEAEAKIGPWAAGKGIEQWLAANPQKKHAANENSKKSKQRQAA